MKKAKGQNNKKERKKSDNFNKQVSPKEDNNKKKNPIILTEDLRNVKSVCGPLISPKATK